MTEDISSTYQFSALLRGQSVIYFSKRGLPNWDQISPTETLLAEYAELPAEGQVLLIGSGHGGLSAALAKSSPGCRFWLLETNYIAMKLSSQTLAANQIENTHIHEDISVLPDQAGNFDVAIVSVPKGRKLAQRWLAEAFSALRVNGRLYLSGAKNLGVRPVIKDAESLFGAGSILAYKKGHRIIRLVKTSDHPPQVGWLEEAGIKPGTWQSIEVDTPQGHFHLYTLPGVFAFDHLDAGTSLLLEQLHITPGERVLDLGCGYGVIGLAAASLGAGPVALVDVNLLAVAAARKNLQSYGYYDAQVLASDAFSAVGDQRFNAIYSNPPFHTGKEVDYQITESFIKSSWDRLEPGGRLVLVANQFIRYDRLLASTFNQVECLAKDGRYNVWQALRSTTPPDLLPSA